jgi:hypothetical protein
MLRDDFDVKGAVPALNFLKELYNYGQEIKKFSTQWDEGKAKTLANVNLLAKELPSLTTKLSMEPRGSQSRPGSLPSVQEQGEPGEEDNIGVYGSEAFQAVLRRAGVAVELIDFFVRYLSLPCLLSYSTFYLIYSAPACRAGCRLSERQISSSGPQIHYTL